MAQLESIDVKCPLCNGKFAAPQVAAGQRVTCPHCSGKVKIAGPVAVSNDDDAWLRLDDDLPAAEPDIFAEPNFVAGPNALANPVRPAATTAKPPQVVPFDDDGFGCFDLPDLPPVAPMPGTKMPGTSMPGTSMLGTRPTTPPPLSEADLDALSGLANDDDQQSAPVKTVRQPELKSADSFRLKCPICESMTYAKVSQVGKKIRCSDCHSTITVPPPPKIRPKYEPDMESAKAYTFQDGESSEAHKKPADPFRKSAEDYLRNAEASVESKPDDDWTVPSIGDWLISVVGIFRDITVVGYWVFFTAMAAIPAAIALQYSSSMIVLGMFGAGIIFGALVVAHGFAILQSISNGEKEVSEWPVADFWAWIGPLIVAASAIGVAAGPIWLLGQYFFGLTLKTVSLAMISLYILYPFVLLSMLNEQSVLVPFSVDVSKSVTRSSDQWGGLYLSSGLLFFVVFMIYLVAFGMPSVVTVTVAIAATVAAVFIYFGLIGRLAYSIGHAINAPPMINDIERKPKLPQ